MTLSIKQQVNEIAELNRSIQILTMTVDLHARTTTFEDTVITVKQKQQKIFVKLNLKKLRHHINQPFLLPVAVSPQRFELWCWYWVRYSVE